MWNRILSCTLAKIFGNVCFASWGKGCGYFACSQTRLVEVVMWQIWYAQKKQGLGFRIRVRVSLQFTSDVPESFLSSQSHEPFESELSQSYLKFFWVESEPSHDLIESSQSRVTTWSSHYESLVYKLESMSSHTNFKLFLYIFGYRSTSGPSVAIGPPVDLQWL